MDNYDENAGQCHLKLPPTLRHDSFNDSNRSELIRFQETKLSSRRRYTVGNVNLPTEVYSTRAESYGEKSNKLKTLVARIINEVPDAVSDTGMTSLRMVVSRIQGSPDSLYKQRRDSVGKPLRTDYLRKGSMDFGIRYSLPAIINAKRLMNERVAKKTKPKQPVVDQVEATHITRDQARLAVKLSAEGVFSTIKCYDDILYDNIRQSFPNVHTQREQTPLELSHMRLPLRIKQKPSCPVKGTHAMEPRLSDGMNEMNDTSNPCKVQLNNTELGINQKINQAVDMVDYFKHQKGHHVTSRRFKRRDFNPIIDYTMWRATWGKLFQ